MVGFSSLSSVPGNLCLPCSVTDVFPLSLQAFSTGLELQAGSLVLVKLLLELLLLLLLLLHVLLLLLVGATIYHHQSFDAACVAAALALLALASSTPSATI